MAVLETKAYELSAHKRALLDSFLRGKRINPAPNRRIPRRPAGAATPLSFAQQRLWFIEQLENGSALYNVPAAFRLKGPLSVPAFERALNQLVRRHETLRATFPVLEGEPLQTFSPELIIPLRYVDLSAVAYEQREARAYELACDDARQPFDLAAGPLLRALLLHLSDDDHIAVLTIHHIVSDGWSMKILARDLAALAEGTPLPPLRIQYADFAAWQREFLSGQALDSQTAYWKHALDGVPDVLDLPADRPRPATQSYAGARRPFSIPGNLLSRLKRLASMHDATLFMVLLAAWQTLLFRYTGQIEIVVGSPVANRNIPDVEDLIGFFVNMLPLCARLVPEQGFRELLRQTRKTTLEAYEHQDLPFEKLVDELRIERDLSRTPLFQTVFVLQNASDGLSRLAGREIGMFPVDIGVAKFDLTLDLTEGTDCASGCFEYRTDLFDDDRIERMQQHYLVLLQSISDNVDTPLSDLQILTSNEGERLATGRISTAFRPVHDDSIHARFEAQVGRTPDAIAVTCEGRCLTYAELNSRANAVAGRLHAIGAGPETRVGLCVERSIGMLVGILGILKAGAAYVPIDPDCPKDRMEYILSDTRAPILLTGKSIAASPSIGDTQVLCIDDVPHGDSCGHSVAVGQNGAAYVIYTSGSTGKPKGVIVEHGNVLRLFHATEDWFHFGNSDVWTLFHSYAFDFSVWEIWGALLYGGRLVVVPYWISRTPDAFYKLLCDEGVTVLNQTPSAFRQLSQVEEELGAGPELKLKYVIFGGEALEFESLRGWFGRHPNAPQMVNMYGITETTVHVTWRPVVPADLDHSGKSAVGIPIPDLRIYLLDSHLQPVPVGVPGEICVGGAGVARGYHDRPDLTAGRFIPNPFGGEPGSRLYRSGDLGRFLPDGDIEYLGRIDHQVKIRGFRIEIGEIEVLLNQHPDLRDAVVMARAGSSGEPRLVAYIVPGAATTPSVAELHEHLKKNLPDYMIPSAFVPMASMPLTSNGKVDRRALPAPEAVQPVSGAPYVAPETPTERVLAEIWRQVLGVAQVGLHDNFFELGGDSILSIQTVSRANQAGVRITAKQLFRNQTIASLAAEADHAASRGELPAAKPGPVPLTPIQHWFFRQNLPNPNHWNQAILLELEQSVDPDALEAAFSSVIEHHDVFGYRFRREGNEWIQMNPGTKASAFLDRFDLSVLPLATREEAFETAVNQMHAGMDLENGPLVRGAYFSYGNEMKPKLIIVAHHLVMDGVSWRALVEELEIACGQLNAGQMVRLPEATHEFQLWAQRLTEYADSETVSKEAEFWTRQTSNPTESTLNLANTEDSVKAVSTVLDRDLTRALLQEVPKAWRVQSGEALLAAFVHVWTEKTHASELLVDLEGHGREPLFDDLDVSRTVGWFTTIFPVLLRPTDTNNPGESLRIVKESLRTIPNNGIGYGVLRYLRGGALPEAAGPQVSFNYLGRLDQSGGRSRVTRMIPGQWGQAHDPRAIRKHLVDVVAWLTDEQLRVEWIYSANVHQESFVRALGAAYVEALRSIVADSLSGDAGKLTPSDFPKAKVSQKSLDKLVSKMSRGAGVRR